MRGLGARIAVGKTITTKHAPNIMVRGNSLEQSGFVDNSVEADITVFYFAPDSKAPITFLELGRFGDQDGVVVCCPPGFYRRTNVKVYCDRYQIKMVDSLNDMVKYICDTAKMVEFP